METDSGLRLSFTMTLRKDKPLLSRHYNKGINAYYLRAINSVSLSGKEHYIIRTGAFPDTGIPALFNRLT